MPEDYKDLVPALMTTDVAAALVGKSLQEVREGVGWFGYWACFRF
jgi:hypothetical protein